MKKTIGLIGGWALLAMGHLAGVFTVGSLITLMVIPSGYARVVTSKIREIPEIWEMSSSALLLHAGLAICVWAMLCIVFQLVKLRLTTKKSPSAIRLSTGSVMTETLIVFPIFFLLTFGMAQLAINNIAGILANVASYEAARAAWVWQPEVGAGRGVTAPIALEKCRIAVAMVMLPVAPGEFISDVRLPTYATQARMLALGANVPFQGALENIAPNIAKNAYQAGAMGLSTGWSRAVQGNLSVSMALDQNRQFWLRTIRKFTHAFHASGCVINADHSVKMTFQLQIAMPFIQRVFGKQQSLMTGSTGVGLREGYFTTYTRDFGFLKQVNTPNAASQNNDGGAVNPFSKGWNVLDTINSL